MASQLIVNADDFGRSQSINEAVIRAHREGILTTASLMVAGDAFEEAATLARQNPKLGVGLHLTLICGKSVLPHSRIPGLVNGSCDFSNDPTAAGMRYFMRSELHQQLEMEIEAQFEKFRATGLTMDHVNGHLHFHLHPTVFGILTRNATAWNIRALRLTHDPLNPDFSLGRGRWIYRLSHAGIFSILSSRAKSVLRKQKIMHTDRVFGLLENGIVNESYVLRLLEKLPPGISELYSHPSMDEFLPEYQALVSASVKKVVTDRGIELIRYQDLL